jgi:hypothetical protein
MHEGVMNWYCNVSNLITGVITQYHKHSTGEPMQITRKNWKAVVQLISEHGLGPIDMVTQEQGTVFNIPVAGITYSLPEDLAHELVTHRRLPEELNGAIVTAGALTI